MPLSEPDLERATELFVRRLQEIIDAEPEIDDIHDAFELYCARRYSLGDLGNQVRVGGKNQLGIDFYSRHEHAFHVGQCKIPERDYLEAHPTKPRTFGLRAVNDIEDALRYLDGKSELQANESIQQLRAQILDATDEKDFSLKLYVVVFGRLKENAIEKFNELKGRFDSNKITLILQQLDDIVEEFLFGLNKANVETNFDLRTNLKEVLRASNYCYFLANSRDIYSAFLAYGWKIFDLNVRMEIKNSPINGEIVGSLTHQKSRKQFHHFNNGLIIIAKNYSFNEREGKVRITGGQVINGLQTVKSIYNAVKSGEVAPGDLEKECVVQVKVIRSSDAEFASGVVRATNNQNPMAPRNLRSNSSEQKSLRTAFTMIEPKWFFQLKEGEWESLTSENAHFFEQVVGYKVSAFRPEPTRRAGRVIDNQDAAKSWLAFIGFADKSGDRVTHYFSEESVYELAFRSRPTSEYWKNFANAIDWDRQRDRGIERVQGDAKQYLLAYFIWRYINSFIPPPARYRELALNEGVAAGTIRKSDGSFKGTEAEHETFLAGNSTYQTWRLMSNMKELLVEATAQILARRYGPLDNACCGRILDSFEAANFRKSADVRDLATKAAIAKDLKDEEVFGRISRMLHFVGGQFWDEEKQRLLSTSRLRTVLVKRESAAAYKKLLWEYDSRIQRDWAWKTAGTTFLNSLPDLEPS